MKPFLPFLCAAGFLCLAFQQCRTQKTNRAVRTLQDYKTPSDDSTLPGDHFPMLLPYNRLIEPAGKTAYYGNPNFENHSLDAAPMPGNKLMAVEDRYGVGIFSLETQRLIDRWTFDKSTQYKNCMSTFSGIKTLTYRDSTFLFWSTAGNNPAASYIMKAFWDNRQLKVVDAISLSAVAPAPIALPNELSLTIENNELYIYAVLNGNNQLAKIRARDKKVLWTAPTGVAPYGLTLVNNKAYVSNWGGPQPVASTTWETAGVPWGSAYVDPRTGATLQGSVSVINVLNGLVEKELSVGLHPNAIISSPDKNFVYVANGNSDYVSVIDTRKNLVADSIDVSLYHVGNQYIGSTPNALALDSTGKTLYVANGLNNAIAVVRLGSKASSVGKGATFIKGFIPTQAYPSGIVCTPRALFVTNLEAIGARVKSKGTDDYNRLLANDVFNSHKQLASVSFIPLPDNNQLLAYTEKVKRLNLQFRAILSRQAPRKDVQPKPVPERIGEPSVFKHIVYIIKENRTYDQVLGDMPGGKGMPSLCIYGDSITPNQHQLAREFSLLDNYYVSGKSSAEGHQWTDAAMVTDYVEKSVRGWFRSYPHVQYDAMVYNKEGFLWNNALDHGKTVRIYGEASNLEYDKSLDWTQIYNRYKSGQTIPFKNVSTISRVRPLLAQSYPGGGDEHFNDQMRADAFINELKEYEKMPGDAWPQLMIMALPNDHTAGLSPGYPTPRAMVADNDLAVGRIIEAISHSRFWDSTAVFITEDDSQAGWDHVSAYRTTGFVISPYGRLQKTVSTNYNQISIVRTIEQILGVPPMNAIDATALPMFDCFSSTPDRSFRYTALPNRIPLNEMNRPLTSLKGKALHYAKASQKEFTRIDDGDDAEENLILWFAAKGNVPYPKQSFTFVK